MQERTHRRSAKRGLASAISIFVIICLVLLGVFIGVNSTQPTQPVAASPKMELNKEKFSEQISDGLIDLFVGIFTFLLPFLILQPLYQKLRLEVEKLKLEIARLKREGPN